MRLISGLLCLAAFVAQPAFAETPPPRLQLLQQRLAATVTENPGEYGIAAMDLTTGEVVSFNGDRPFPMASTVKVAIAATYLAEVDAGRRTLSDPVGASTAEALMNLMLIHSDNHATDMLLATLGGPQVVDQWLHAQNLSGIRMDRTIAELLAARRDLNDVRDSSTPQAMLRLLQRIDSGNALKPGSRYVLLDIMHRCATGSNRIKALLPPGTRVEHKTGTLTGYTGDVAYVTLPDGRRIAMVLFGRGGGNRPGLIATIARAIYDGFAAAPGNVQASFVAPPSVARMSVDSEGR